MARRAFRWFTTGHVVIAALAVSVIALAVLLSLNAASAGHDVSSISNDVVLDPAAWVARAERMDTLFRARAAGVADQLDVMQAQPIADISRSELKSLAHDVNALVMLRCAVTGTWAQLEEIMARDDDVSQELLQVTTDAYARFGNDFDMAVVSVFGGKVAASPNAAVGSTSTPRPRVIRRARTSMRTSIADAVLIEAELKRVERVVQ